VAKQLKMREQTMKQQKMFWDEALLSIWNSPPVKEMGILVTGSLSDHALI